MPKGSKKGACSAHIETAKANCLQHARREGKIPGYVNPHLTPNNRTVFEDDTIKARKSIVPLVKRAEIEYSEKTGQKCQKSFTPFREDVLKLREGVTDEQLMAFKSKTEALTGWKVLGIWVHQDEGHAHSKYIEGDEDFQLNIHAHVLYDCQDHATGKAIRPQRKYFSLRQDLLAESTGMERGNRAADTGIRHRKSAQQRIQSQEQRISELERIARERERKNREKLQLMADERERVAKNNLLLEKETSDLINTYNDFVKNYKDLDDDYKQLLKDYNGLVDEHNDLIDRIEKASVAVEEAERANSQIQEKKTLLVALNAQIEHARATAAAMGVGVDAKMINTPNGWMLYANVGNASLPTKNVSDEDAKAYKRGDMPTEILVAKYHPRAYQPSPEVVEQFVKNHPKR